MRHALILAGGSGTRLWPMSRAATPKQLIPLFGGRSLLSVAFDRLEGVIPADRRRVCAPEAYREAIIGALPGMGKRGFLGEPEPRDTLAAIGYASAVIAREDPEAVIGVFPADHIIRPEERLRSLIDAGFTLAEERPDVFVTFGVTPSFPATSYGYLKLGARLPGGARTVEEFREKPDEKTVRRYVKAGPARYLWNSGMFVWRAAALLDLVARYEPAAREALSLIAGAWGTADFPQALARGYAAIRKTSIDYAVMEKACRDPSVGVAALPMELSWTDVGSWPAFGDTLDHDEAGNAAAADKALIQAGSNCLVVSNEPGHVVALLGCEDLTVVHTPDVTLVCGKDRAEEVKKLRALAVERFGPRYG